MQFLRCASFLGVEIGVMADHGVHVCGVRGESDEYVIFQRGESDMSTSDIHFEYVDQINGGYDFVRECRLSRGRLIIELSRPIPSMPGVDGIDVSLDVDESAFQLLRGGLETIFAPCPERLVIG
jgi:hypothetical protein